MTENLTIKEVTKQKDYFSISTKEGSGFGFPTKYKVTPKVGDRITLHCVNGSSIRGIDLNGKKVFYKSDEQLEQEHKEYCDKAKKDKLKRFKKDKPRLDKSYKALPKCFQERIDKFRNNNPEFRVEFESYEMFCCEQAVEIAKACKTIENIDKFKNLEWDEQKKMVKKLDDGHSGNTFGCSCSLAYWFLKEQENVIKMHGALAPLVGSEEYGCVPKKK